MPRTGARVEVLFRVPRTRAVEGGEGKSVPFRVPRTGVEPFRVPRTGAEDYLKKLSDEGFITVYGFVIMPNHVHLIWKQNKLNGKETPQGSFLKYTAHEFLKKLKTENKSYLYEVHSANKKHEIWQRDSLSIALYTRKVAEQKLRYIHLNPVSKKWSLAKDDLDYYWSSARYYEYGMDEFGFLSNLFVD